MPSDAEARSDEEIARDVQGGDTSAFGLIMERYGAKMRRYARRFLFGYHDAEDHVQEVFLKAYVNIRSYDASRKFSSWLYRVAHNEFINAIRKRGREPVAALDPDTFLPHLAAKERADDAALAAETRALLDRGLASLDPKYREPLVLFYDEGLDYREIADVLHIPISTVGVRLNRGRAALKKAVEGKT